MATKVDSIPVFQVIQLKSAVKLEKLGMKHSSGRSARKYACELLGIPVRTSHDEVVQILQEMLDNG